MTKPDIKRSIRMNVEYERNTERSYQTMEEVAKKHGFRARRAKNGTGLLIYTAGLYPKYRGKIYVSPASPDTDIGPTPIASGRNADLESLREAMCDALLDAKLLTPAMPYDEFNAYLRERIRG